MDYTTVPRSLIYRERRSLEEFGIYEEDCIMRPLSDAIFDFDFIRAPNAEERARWCMNNAFYICTMFLLERDPKWRYDQYKRIATPEKNGFPTDLHFVTLSLVGLLLSRLEENIPLLSAKGKVKNSFIMSMLGNEEHKYIFYHLSDILEIDSFKQMRIPNSTFAPRVINAEAVHDVLMDENFNWVKFTNYWEERSLRDIVKSLGKTEEEKHHVIDILRQTSHGFYAKGLRCEQVDDLLNDIDNDIHLQYNPEDAVVGEDENDEQNYYLELKPYEEARIDMLEHENAKLREEVKQLKEYIKGAITIDVDNEVVDLGEFGSIVDNAPKTHGDTTDKVEKNKSADSQQENKLENLIGNGQQSIEETPKYIESLNLQLSEEKEKNAQLESENKQLREVLELDKIMESDTKRLQIDERIILITTALGTPWNSDLTNQTQLAKIIEYFSGDNWRSIRSRIVTINSEMKQEIKTPGEGLSQGTKEAISNVIDWLKKATNGEQNTPTTDNLIKEIKDVFLNTME